MTETIEQLAESIARRAHDGQVDKAGLPYIAHPARVAARVAGDARQVAVAWLHDVVEDTDVTLEQLLEAGLPEDVVAGVDAITKRAGEPVEGYFARVGGDPLARAVRLADLADNSDPTRLAMLDAETRARLVAKYDRARRLLVA